MVFQKTCYIIQPYQSSVKAFYLGIEIVKKQSVLRYAVGETYLYSSFATKKSSHIPLRPLLMMYLNWSYMCLTLTYFTFILFKILFYVFEDYLSLRILHLGRIRKIAA